MSRRGHAAPLPTTAVRRPPVLVSDGLVVEHRDGAGAVAVYDFRALPVEDALRRSLARLFAARCVPSRWTSHHSSKHFWGPLQAFTAYLAALDAPVADIDQLTAGTWKQWRLSRANTMFGYRQIVTVRGLLLDDPRLNAAAREALSQRVLAPKAKETSFESAEFDAIVSTARRMFRTAHLRITDNAHHLAQWQSGAFTRGSGAWLLGEALDCVARTGEAPHDTRIRQRGRVPARYAKALGGESSEHTWQRLFMTRMETVALGVLLMAEHGWNLSVINRLKVPQATPDAGSDSTRIYRVELEKHKRGTGRYFETRNLTDDGAASPGRLITQALEATVFARAAVHTLAPGTDRFLIWRSARAPLDGNPQDDPSKKSGVGVFGFGIYGCTAHRWATQQGFSASPFRRGRRTVNTLHRREPGQNSQATHDHVYALTDPQVRQAACMSTACSPSPCGS
ncbi:hypothetical protein ACFYM3_13525 [Streptomyces massasporeus]|uniref:Uncharacterized protein n=1 Tax=Streptomyces massasporeus TaxID=67324 RepID=A0ABW6LC01_9ACTN